MTERWVPVPGFAAYEVSDQGRVRSIKVPGVKTQGVELKQSWTRRHLAVGLYRDGGQVRRYVHQLVLEAFIGPRPTPKHHARHLDDESTNNNLSNLAWGTPSQNAEDKVRNNRHHWSRRTHCEAGHPFSDDNLIERSDGGRRCRTCHRIASAAASRRYRAKKIKP